MLIKSKPFLAIHFLSAIGLVFLIYQMVFAMSDIGLYQHLAIIGYGFTTDMFILYIVFTFFVTLLLLYKTTDFISLDEVFVAMNFASSLFLFFLIGLYLFERPSFGIGILALIYFIAISYLNLLSMAQINS